MAMPVFSLFSLGAFLFLLSLSLVGGELLLEFVETVHCDVRLWELRFEICRKAEEQDRETVLLGWNGQEMRLAGYDVRVL